MKKSLAILLSLFFLTATSLNAQLQFKVKATKAHLIEKFSSGKISSEIDTNSGYRKYYFENGQLEMEGKVTKNYRDSVWKYYLENGLLSSQETYSSKGKINSKQFNYFKNGKLMSETYDFFEGTPNTSNFKFHKLESLYYTNGNLFVQRHYINNNLIESKCWDSKGNPKPLEYANSIETLDQK